MYEGKHIHHSEDGKLLCSYTAKLCKQRRINNYGFCIRHVLEDKSAPFKQCAFVVKCSSQQQCSNAIPIEKEQEYCSSHLQVMGLIPKGVKKRKRNNTGEGLTMSPGDPNQLLTVDTNCDPSRSRSKHKKRKKKKRKRDKHRAKMKEAAAALRKGKHSDKESSDSLSHLSAFLPNGSNTLPTDIRKNIHSRFDSILPNDKSVTKLKSITKRPKGGQRKGGELRKAQKRSMGKSNSISTSEATLHTNNRTPKPSQRVEPTPEELAHMAELSAFCQLNKHELVAREKPCKARTLFHEKIGTKSVDSLRSHLQAREERRQDLYHLGLEYSDYEDSDTESDPLWRHRYHWSFLSCRRKSSVTGASTEATCSSLRQNCQKLTYLQRCDRYEQKAQQDLSKKLIQSARAHPFGTTVSYLRSMDRPFERPTLPNRTERICCSKENGDDCHEEVVPFARHCFRHILEDENQMLFYQCAAEFPGGLRCIEPCFDVMNEQPLCIEHAKTMRVEPKLKKPKKKTKPFALTKPFRKRRNQQKRNVRPQKPIPPAEPLMCLPKLPSFSTKFTATNVTPTKLDSEGEIAANEMNLILGLNDDDLDSMVAGDEEGATLNSDGEEEDISKLLPKELNEIFLGKNGDGLYSKDDADVLEKLFEVSEQIKLDIDGSVRTNEGATELDDVVVGDDLPSDLQSAANKLMEDMRDHENHPNTDMIPLPPQTVPSCSTPSVQQAPVNPNQAILNALAGSTTPVPPNSFSPNNVPPPLPGTELNSSPPVMGNTFMPPNGMFSMNPASAMLHMAAMSQQIGLNQGLPPPHGPMHRVPAPAMSPHNPHMVNNLPQHSPSQPPVAVQGDGMLQGAVTQPTVLPSFRQIWNTSPSMSHMNRGTMANGLIPHSAPLDASATASQLHFQQQLTNTASYLQRHSSFGSGLAGLDPAQMMKAVANLANLNGATVSQPQVTSPGQYTSLQQALLGAPRLNPSSLPMHTTSPIMSVNNPNAVHNVPPPKT